MILKIATITFNHAHNHGSMLQTYALQQFVYGLGNKADAVIDYRVIDYHTDNQRAIYAVFKKNFSIKSLMKNLIAARHIFTLKKRHKKFEQFLKDYCSITRCYRCPEELMTEPPEADVYISGSDQLWNVRAKDFSEVYYLSFVKKGKRISYAASLGPLKIDWEKYDTAKYASLLQNYAFISTREQGSADNVEKLIGRQPEIHVDPTLLLTKNEWRRIQSDANYNNGNYILLYSLEPTKLQLNMAKAISKKLRLPIVVLRYNNKNDWFNSFVHRYDAGPCDFLSYIDHAALVLSSSFHGTAFSLIYHKPFYVFNGLTDNRISSILTHTGLLNRSIATMDDISKVKIQPLNEKEIDNFLAKERLRSADYLCRAIALS
ncbi:polysaccharide pyruvyl transferase family protein [Parabacteroides distasonis]|uniref:polysaccharide pyruvyl transferase family protein n=1 Tax=Parabacteroides distasonis TaxID=823 RepID=UPI0032C0CDED